jgi:tRNA threonylcarbamoyladenosine biosynthesis protein TsaE
VPPRISSEGPAVTVRTTAAEETRLLGQRCGQYLSRPAVILLVGALGSGKTVFVQGLARGLDVPADYYITSPSFTIVNHYEGRLPLYHIDLYRLNADLDPEDLGLTEILHGDGVAAVEWADKLPAGCAPDRLEIRFEVDADDQRTLHFRAYGQEASGLLKALDRFTALSRTDPAQG